MDDPVEHDDIEEVVELADPNPEAKEILLATVYLQMFPLFLNVFDGIEEAFASFGAESNSGSTKKMEARKKNQFHVMFEPNKAIPFTLFV